MSTEIEHITPEENELSSIHTNILCDVEGCGRTFKSMSVLKFHQSQFHQCKRIQKTIKDLHIEERFHCPVKDCIYYYSACTISRYFEKMRYLKQHYLKVHSACSFPCNLCNKSFSTKSYLRAHQMYCDLDIVCSCGQKFVSITSIQTHVKRKGHEAEVLEVYARRLGVNKSKKVEEAPKSQSTQERFLLPKSSSSSSYTSPVISVPHQGHLNAAIALSELAFAGLKRISTVEVGVQTEPTASRRLSRKSSSPIRSREPQSKKRKQTTEMETQTQLTDLKNKSRRRGAKRVAKCSIATGTHVRNVGSQLASEKMPSKVFKCDIGLECNYNLFSEKEPSCSSLGGEIYKSANGKNYFNQHNQHLNSSGTQTTTAVDFEVLVSSHEENCLSYDFFPGEERINKETLDQSQISSCTIVEMPEEAHSKERYPDVLRIDVTEKADEIHTINSQFESSQILLDDEDSLVGLNPSGELSSLISHRAPSLSSQNRSSSIETQTEHDVFLSTHVQTPDDADDIILTSAETQTFEEFSDIEPFLCSFTDTQTVGEHHSSSELFPELNSFTSDMQTQTNSEDPPNCVTTHTQTTIFGLSSS